MPPCMQACKRAQPWPTGRARSPAAPALTQHVDSQRLLAGRRPPAPPAAAAAEGRQQPGVHQHAHPLQRVLFGVQLLEALAVLAVARLLGGRREQESGGWGVSRESGRQTRRCRRQGLQDAPGAAPNSSRRQRPPAASSTQRACCALSRAISSAVRLGRRAFLAAGGACSPPTSAAPAGPPPRWLPPGCHSSSSSPARLPSRVVGRRVPRVGPRRPLLPGTRAGAPSVEAGLAKSS